MRSFFRGDTPANLPLPIDEILRAGQGIQPHRAAYMELLRTDADFCAKAELEAVRKSCRGIDIDGRGIHSLLKVMCRPYVVRDNRFGVPRIIAIDMRDSCIEILHDADGQDEIPVLG